MGGVAQRDGPKGEKEKLAMLRRTVVGNTYACLDFRFIVTSIRMLLTWKGTADVQQKDVEVRVFTAFLQIAGIVQSRTQPVLPVPIDCDTCHAHLTCPLTILYDLCTGVYHNIVVWIMCKFEFTF